MSVDDRRRVILDQAARLFEQKGFDATSMQEIAEAIGVTKTALYYYFKNKQAILFELHDAFITDLTERAEAFEATTQDPLEHLSLFIHSIIDNIADYQHYVLVFFQDMRKLNADQFATIRAKREAYAELLIDVVRSGIASGQLRGDLNPTLAALMVFGACNWTYQWMRPEGPLTPDQIADAFFAMLQGGLAPSPVLSIRAGNADFP